MKILMTQRELLKRGGSELFTIEVAKELKERGHEVAIYSPNFGDLIQTLLNAGIWVKDKLDALPWVPDIIHGQHHLQTIAALAYFENVTAVYHCHGVQPWVEKPPLHSRIQYYIMMCKWMEPRMEPEFGIEKERVCTVANFVNTRRFSRVRTAPDRPQRALLFGNGKLHKQEVTRLETACTASGLSLDKIGAGYANVQVRPEMFLQDYDLVFAIGKCAMEAMACGCAVITVMPGQAGQLVTPGNFDKWAYSNFSPRYFTSAAEIATDWLQGELENYSMEDVSTVCQRLRSEHTLADAVSRLESIYQKITSETLQTSPRSTVREMAPYLEMLSNEVDALWVRGSASENLKQRKQELDKKVELYRQKNEDLKARNDQLHKQNEKLRKHSKLGSWFLPRKLKKTP